jgi:hypothetical protein
MQTTETMSPRSHVVPLLECEPWCEDGDGHPTDHPVDRRCLASVADVAMTLPEPYQERGGAWVLAMTGVHLRREPGEGFTRVLLNHMAGGKRGEEVDQWIEFTADEAEHLTAALSSALSVARGAISESEAVSAALLEALGRHLEKPVNMNELQALCEVVGVKPSEITRRAEEIQRGA